MSQSPKIKFRRIEEGFIKTYEFDSFDEVKNWADHQVEKYKVKNRVQDEEKDRRFISFKAELQDFIGKFA